MYHVLPQVLAADHITELHREAARQRLIHELRQRPGRPSRRRTLRKRPVVRQPRPAGA
jgi:hypothetical protein